MGNLQSNNMAMRNLIICLLSLVLSAPLFAQQPQTASTEAEETEIRRYTVEVIVFRYAQEVSTGSEVFVPDEPATEPDAMIDAAPEFVQVVPPETAADAESEPLPDIEFSLLAEEDYQLGEIYRRMRRLDVYEPVMHFGWTQATWPQEQTEAIALHRFARPPADLDGTLTLYLSRYLHLVVDLALQAPRVASVSRDEMAGPAGERTVGELLAYIDDDDRAPLSTYYRIQEDRILKNGELRYYDHPKFGVLAKVTRVEQLDEDQSGEGELLGYPAE